MSSGNALRETAHALLKAAEEQDELQKQIVNTNIELDKLRGELENEKCKIEKFMKTLQMAIEEYNN